MKKVTLLCAMLLAVSAAAASAQGLNLNWNQCLGDGRVANKNSACTLNTGTNAAIGSFVLGNDVLGATGIEVVLDLASAGATLPAWWSFQTGGCRQGSLTMNPSISLSAINCFEWGGGAAGGLAAYTVGAYYGPSSARVLGGFAVAPPGSDVFAAGGEYFAFNLLVNNLKSTGTGSCAGCTTPVCLSLNNIKMVAGTLTGAIINTPATPASNTITWQGGAGVSSTLGGGCPAATPSKNATWGSVKSLYR
jgi:hypothetical protein